MTAAGEACDTRKPDRGARREKEAEAGRGRAEAHDCIAPVDGATRRTPHIKSIGVPCCHPMAKGISIGRSFCHILCHIAILRAKSAQDSQKDIAVAILCAKDVDQ